MAHERQSSAPEAVSSSRIPTARESAIYTYDMLVSLKRMAEAQKLSRLASLIEAAAAEAKVHSSRE